MTFHSIGVKDKDLTGFRRCTSLKSVTPYTPTLALAHDAVSTGTCFLSQTRSDMTFPLPRKLFVIYPHRYLLSFMPLLRCYHCLKLLCPVSLPFYFILFSYNTFHLTREIIHLLIIFSVSLFLTEHKVCENEEYFLFFFVFLLSYSQDPQNSVYQIAHIF